MLVLFLALTKALCVVTSVASGDTTRELLRRLFFESVVVCGISGVDIYVLQRRGGHGVNSEAPSLPAALGRLPWYLVVGVAASDFFLDFSNIVGIQRIGHAGNAAVGMCDVAIALAFDCVFHRRTAVLRVSDFAIVACVAVGLGLYFMGQHRDFHLDDCEGIAASFLSAVFLQLSVALERWAVRASGSRSSILFLTHALAPVVCGGLLWGGWCGDGGADGDGASMVSGADVHVVALVVATCAKAAYMMVKLTMHTQNFSNVYHTVMTSLMLFLRFAMSSTRLVTRRVEHNLPSYVGLALLAVGAGVNHSVEAAARRRAAAPPPTATHAHSE